MNFNLTEEQKLVQESAAEFVRKSIAPVATQIDRESKVPQELIREMGSMGFLGAAQPEAYGGTGAGMQGFVLILEQLAKGSSGAALVASLNNLGMSSISQFGTDAQKKQWLPKCCSGENLASFAFTEPGTGSDPKSLETTAVKKGDKFIINGNKRFITLGDVHGPITIFAKDEEGQGVTAFLVEKLCPGYSLDEHWEKIGDHGPSLYDIYFKDMEVHESQILGERGNAYPILLRSIGFGKTGLSAKALGVAGEAFDETLKYAKERLHRGKPITKFDSMQLRIAEMAMKLEAAKWIVYYQAFLVDSNASNFITHAAVAKEFATQSCVQIVQMAIEAHGAYGLTLDYKVERMYRDAIIGRNVEGTTDLQRKIIASAYIK